MRTAHFFGADAIAISNRSSAPLSPVALKASAGASEYIPLLSITSAGEFIDTSRKNGWKFYASVAPLSPSKTKALQPKYQSLSSLRDSLQLHPCVLLLGGEGGGIQFNLQKKADYRIGIAGQGEQQNSVDSLNVGVAFGIICESFTRKMATPATRLAGSVKEGNAETSAVDDSGEHGPDQTGQSPSKDRVF